MAYTTKIISVKVVESDSVIITIDDKEYAFDNLADAATFASDYINGL